MRVKANGRLELNGIIINPHQLIENEHLAMAALEMGFGYQVEAEALPAEDAQAEEKARRLSLSGLFR